MADLSWSAASANVFTEVTGTYTFTDDDIRAVYVDWSDGTDPAGSFTNKKEYANYQWYATTTPTGGVALTHTYTATGTFDPVTQVVNSDGFASKYHARTSTASWSGDVTPYTQSSGTMNAINMYDGTATGLMRLENKTVKSGIDNSIFEVEGAKDIGVLVPPLCTAAELTTISSITLEIECIVESSMISTTDETILGGAGTSIQTLTKTISSLSTEQAIESISITGGKCKKILKVTYKNPKYVGASGATAYDENNAYKNLKIFIVVPGNDARYYPITYVSPGSPIKRAEDPLRYVTLDFSQSRAKASNVSIDSYRYDNGKVWFSPVNQWNTVFIDSTCDPGNGVATMTMDNTAQILTGASVSGTGIDASTTVTSVDSATQLTLSDSSLTTGTNIRCVFGYSKTFGSDTQQTAATKQVNYAYSSVRGNGLGGSSTINSKQAIAFGNNSDDKWARDSATDQVYRVDQFIVDEFGRFTDQYHLTRMLADPNTTDKDAILNVSSITDNQPDVFRITPTLLSTMSLATSGSATKIDVAPATSGNYSDVYTYEAFQNGSPFLVSLSGMNTQTFNNFAGSARTDNEYILLLFSEKTNKVFFNINNYANGLIDANLAGSSFTTPWKISGVSYLSLTDSGTKRQNANWTPVQFEDTTKVSMEYKNDTDDKYEEQSNSLSQSGYISYDMPLDWSATTLENLCGGQFDTAMTTSTSGANDVKITGTVTDLGSGSNGFGGVLEFGTGDTLTGAEVLLGKIKEDTFGKYDELGAFKYIAFCVDTGSSTAANCENKPLWVASGTSDGMSINGRKLYLTYGEDDTSYTPSNLDGNTSVVFVIRRVNIYDVFNGVSKVEEGDGTSATKLVPVDSSVTAFPSTYILSNTAGTADTPVAGSPTNLGRDLKTAWSGNSLYALKIDLSGAAGTPGGATEDLYPEIWNIFDGNRGYCDVIKEVDDSAYNLNALPITSDIAVGRGGAYYSAITRKGKVFISRTGDTIENIGFGSKGLGDSSSSTAFEDYGTPSAMYGQLRKIRALHANVVRVFWDERQKDGTYTRYWGIITNVDETHGMGGPKSILSYNFNVMIEEIALLDKNGNLMTDIFPLGGIGNEKNFT